MCELTTHSTFFQNKILTVASLTELPKEIGYYLKLSQLISCENSACELRSQF